ncbi:MAG TPA: hypothetical protein VEZ46_15035, partial [Mycobacteriales bacterium]|nr:hypothetical protein [Mycobacteriales bacterium]
VSGSIGITVASSDGDFADMLRDADSALYAAKSVGGNTAQAFQPEMCERVAHRMERRRRPVA